MKTFKFILSSVFSLALILSLNSKFGQVPPLGKFLDPINGFWANAKQGLDVPSGSLQLPDLKEEVKVYYDKDMIPHVFANNDHDLYMAQGYLTAQNRLWQMEFQTHAASGRISEIIGSDALEFDRTQRRIGLVFGAENTLKEMEKDTEIMALHEAYTAGVNALIRSLNYRDLPLEYKLLDYKPENWEPIKTAILLSYMGNSLSGGDVDFENTALVKALGLERFNLLFPEYLANSDPIIPADQKWGFQAKKVIKPDAINYPATSLPDANEFAPNPDNGSNNWAVSGSKTISGKPILANDPHLGLNLPSLWYVMQLNSPNVNTMGGTLTGALGVILGFNDSIAWGCTNATRDVKDWYAITFKNEQRDEYLYDGKWLKSQKRIEEFRPRGADLYYDTIVYTHYGPVVYDHNFGVRKEKVNYALKWTLHGPSSEGATFLKLNSAHNYDDYLAALQYYRNPAQNFAFASASGDIAMWINGAFPLRWEGQGKFVMDGSNAAYEWAGYIPQSHNPYSKNPKRGFVSSANQHPTAPNYPYWGYDGHYENFRNRRINQILAESSNISAQDMMKLQNDNYHILASEALPVLLELIKDQELNEQEKAGLKLLTNWNLWANANEKAVPYFEAWWNSFYAAVWKGLRNSVPEGRVPEKTVTVNFLVDNILAEVMMPENDNSDLANIALVSFKEGVEKIEKWKSANKQDLNWGNYKSTTAKHLARLDAFSSRNIAVGGNSSIINANSSSHGASWRYVVSFEENGLKAYGIYPGGQSGNPGSPYYDNMIARWRDGEYMELTFMHDANDQRYELPYQLTLKPENK